VWTRFRGNETRRNNGGDSSVRDWTIERGTDRTEKFSSIIASSPVAGETTFPQSNSLETDFLTIACSYKHDDRKSSVKKVMDREPQGAWHQDKLMGGKPPVVK
jgi:hypothetical protein